MSIVAVDLHGLAVHIACPDDEVRATIAARLADLPPAAAPEPDLTLSYDFSGPAHVPPADARVVYASPASHAYYAPGEEAFYAIHEDGATMRCSASDGVAEIRASTTAESRVWVLTRPLLTLALMELARARGLQPLHAACLARDGAGIVVTGPSGSGKSTVALALLAAGYDYVSEDLVFLRGEGDALLVCGFPDELGLTEHASSLFPALHRVAVPAPGWPKGRAGLSEVAPDARIVGACPPALVLHLDPQATEVDEISADDALLELLPSMLLTAPDTCRRQMAAFAALATAATCLRLPARPDLDAAVELVDAARPLAGRIRTEVLR